MLVGKDRCQLPDLLLGLERPPAKPQGVQGDSAGGQRWREEEGVNEEAGRGR